jgi:hypothetical protein
MILGLIISAVRRLLPVHFSNGVAILHAILCRRLNRDCAKTNRIDLLFADPPAKGIW